MMNFSAKCCFGDIMGPINLKEYKCMRRRRRARPCAQAIQRLNDLYAKQGNAGALRDLLTELRPLFAVIPKAKTAKIVRTIIETIAKVPNSTQLQVRSAAPLGQQGTAEHSCDLVLQLNILTGKRLEWLCMLLGGMRVHILCPPA